MRVISALALIGATTAKPIDVETTVETITEAETTVPETEAITTTTTAAPKKLMPTLPSNYKPMFSENQKFRSFAVQNHFPPVMQEREMMAQMNFNGRFKTPQGNPFVQQQQRQQQGGLQCMECSGQSYEHCYANARMRQCPQQETACFLEVRYQGQQVVSVQSGCSQEIACINNMKQNFYDFNEYGQGGVNQLDSGRHDCKVFSGNPFANSVCRNCCFSENCTDGWQPQTFEDWNIADRKEVKKQMQLFDQFVYAPNHWDNVKQQQTHRNSPGSIQYANSLAELNRPPTFADLNKNSNKNIQRTPTVAKKQPKDHVASFRSKQLAQQRKQQQQRQLMQQRQMQGSGRFGQPKVLNMRTTQKVATTKKPVVRQYQRKTTTKRVTTTRRVTTTEKPTTKAAVVPDTDFMALIAKLEAEKQAPTPATKTMAKKKVSSKKTKPSVQLKSAQKKTVKTTRAPKTTEAATTKPVATAKPAAAKKPAGKGPWSHLPPWKQRQLQAARAKAIAAAKAKKASALKQKQAQPQMMKFSSSVTAPDVKLEEGPIIEVNTNLSDEDFGKLIASIDTKDKATDFDAIISAIEAEN